MQEYDAIVVGSGQGGNPMAHKLADLGWNVALVEKGHLGGSCINYGCTPTKTMVASARVAHVARRSADFGVNVGDVAVHLDEVVARKDEMVLSWRGGQEQQVAKRPSLDLHRGHGRFTGPHTVSVDGRVLHAEHIFIDTGTRPRIPDIEGLDEVDYLTNMNVMDVTDLPEHLVVLGGSYIGLEFGQMFRRFGSKVTVVEHNDQLVPREDADVADALKDALTAEGIDVVLGAQATGVRRTGDGLVVDVEAADGAALTVAGTHLLVAVGRVPNTDDLGLDAAGIETNERGYVVANDRLETNVPGVYAIGDVKGGPAFTHISYDDHLVLYDNLLNGGNRSIANRIIPYALFTDPELGRVGMTEKAARAAGYRLKVGSIPMSYVARALERDETAGLMKIVIDADTDRILGAAILGVEGGELVQIIMTAMMAGAPWTMFRRAIYIHPTLAEGFFALMESVEAVDER